MSKFESIASLINPSLLSPFLGDRLHTTFDCVHDIKPNSEHDVAFSFFLNIYYYLFGCTMS